MQDFLANLNQSYWWLSVVVVGIIINLMSALIQRYFNKQASSISSWWLQRSQRRQAEFLKDIGKIVDNPEKRLALHFEEIRHRSNCGIVLTGSVLSFVIYIITLLLSPSIDGEMRIYNSLLQFIFPLLGIFFFFASYSESGKAAYKKHVLRECHRYIDGDVFIHSAKYGIDDLNNSDVTSQLREAVRDGRLEITANNRLGGDPAPDQRKKLTVVYSYAGQRHTIETPENQRLSLPEA